jgi:hypothetical protein
MTLTLTDLHETLSAEQLFMKNSYTKFNENLTSCKPGNCGDHCMPQSQTKHIDGEGTVDTWV